MNSCSAEEQNAIHYARWEFAYHGHVVLQEDSPLYEPFKIKEFLSNVSTMPFKKNPVTMEADWQNVRQNFLANPANLKGNRAQRQQLQMDATQPFVTEFCKLVMCEITQWCQLEEWQQREVQPQQEGKVNNQFFTLADNNEKKLTIEVVQLKTNPFAEHQALHSDIQKPDKALFAMCSGDKKQFSLSFAKGIPHMATKTSFSADKAANLQLTTQWFAPTDVVIMNSRLVHAGTNGDGKAAQTRFHFHCGAPPGDKIFKPPRIIQTKCDDCTVPWFIYIYQMRLPRQRTGRVSYGVREVHECTSCVRSPCF